MGSFLAVFYAMIALTIHSEHPIWQVEGDKWYLPDHVVTQTGGYVGFVSYGLGYEFTYYSPELILGHTPEIIADEDIWSLAFKNTLHSKYKTSPWGLKVRPYMGISALYSINDPDTFIRQPSQYPDKYYPSNGLRTAPYVGIDFKYEDITFYVEATILDLYLETYVRSDGALPINEAGTYSFGWKLDL